MVYYQHPPGFPDIITTEFGVQLHQLGIGGQRCWTEIRRQFATPRERTVSACGCSCLGWVIFHAQPQVGRTILSFLGVAKLAYFQGWRCNGKGDCCAFFLGDGRWGVEKELVFFLGEFGRYPTTPPNKTIRFLLISLDFCLKQVNKEGQTETLFWNRFSRGFLKSFLKRWPLLFNPVPLAGVGTLLFFCKVAISHHIQGIYIYMYIYSTQQNKLWCYIYICQLIVLASIFIV